MNKKNIIILTILVINSICFADTQFISPQQFPKFIKYSYKDINLIIDLRSKFSDKDIITNIYNDCDTEMKTVIDNLRKSDKPDTFIMEKLISNGEQKIYDILIEVYNDINDPDKIDSNIIKMQDALVYKLKLGDIYKCLGRLYKKKGLLKESIRYYKMAASYKFDYPLDYYDIGKILFDSGDYKTSIKCFNNALEFKYLPAEHKSLIHFYLGKALYKTGDISKAVYNFKETIKNNNRFEQAYFNLGNCYMDMNYFDKAMDEYKKSLKYYSEKKDAYGEGNALFNIALCYLKKEDKSSSINFYYRAALKFLSINSEKSVAECLKNMKSINKKSSLIKKLNNKIAKKKSDGTN